MASRNSGTRLAMPRTRMAARRGERGLTLVELMVAILISMFMVGALIVLYLNNNAARVELDRSSRQIENGRFAIDMLRDDIALAGYYGELSARDIAEFREANPCTTAAANMGWSTAAAPTPVRAPAPLQGPGTSTTLPASWGCANVNQKDDTGYLIVRRLSPTIVAPAAALANTLYVQSNGCLTGTVTHRLALGPGATNFDLKGPDCTSLSPARAYVSRLYYVATCGVCSPSDGVPTLKMRELQGNSIVERIVSDGIEDLQFEFGRDTNGDGVVDDFVANGTASDWPNVVAVRIRLISRATSASPGYTDAKSYDRGSLFTAYSPAAGETQFKRRSYTALVSLPNVAGPRENP